MHQYRNVTRFAVGDGLLHGLPKPQLFGPFYFDEQAVNVRGYVGGISPPLELLTAVCFAPDDISKNLSCLAFADLSLSLAFHAHRVASVELAAARPFKPAVTIQKVSPPLPRRVGGGTFVVTDVLRRINWKWLPINGFEAVPD
jgi:hypothetical protein